MRAPPRPKNPVRETKGERQLTFCVNRYKIVIYVDPKGNDPFRVHAMTSRYAPALPPATALLLCHIGAVGDGGVRVIIEIFRYSWRCIRRGLCDAWNSASVSTFFLSLLCFFPAWVLHWQLTKFFPHWDIGDPMGEWWVFLIYVVFGIGIIVIFQTAYNLVLAPVRFDMEQRSEISELKKKTEHPKLKIFYDETIHRTLGPMGTGYGMQNIMVTRINVGVKCESLGVPTVIGVKVKIANIQDSSTPIQRHRHQFLPIKDAGPVIPIEHEMTLSSGETGEFQLEVIPKPV